MKTKIARRQSCQALLGVVALQTLGVFAAGVPLAQAAAANRPNIVFILADDKY